MMNDDMLRNIEYLREKANVSYEEASELLERNGGNVMRVLVELEQQGRVYQQAGGESAQAGPQATYQNNHQQTKEKATAFINKALQSRLVIEKKRENGEKDTLINVSIPVAVGAAILGPYFAVGAVILTFATGCQVKIKKREKDTAKDAQA